MGSRKSNDVAYTSLQQIIGWGGGVAHEKPPVSCKLSGRAAQLSVVLDVGVHNSQKNGCGCRIKHFPWKENCSLKNVLKLIAL